MKKSGRRNGSDGGCEAGALSKDVTLCSPAFESAPASHPLSRAVTKTQLVHELRRIDVHDRLHDREGVLGVFDGLAIELTTIGLVILFADRLLADRRIDGEA